MVTSPTISKSCITEDLKGSHERFDKDITELPFVVDGEWFPISRPAEIFMTQSLCVHCIMENVVLKE